MKEFSKYVDLDVPKDSIGVAVADGSDGETRYQGEIPKKQFASWSDSSDVMAQHSRSVMRLAAAVMEYIATYPVVVLIVSWSPPP